MLDADDMVARIDVVEYEDAATALMPTDQQPVRITERTLRPRTVDRPAASETATRPSPVAKLEASLRMKRDSGTSGSR